MTDVFAFIVTVEVGGEHHQHVVAGPNLVAAAATAQERLQERHGAVARVIKMELLAEMLGAPHTASREPTAPVSAVPSGSAPETARKPSSRRAGTRQEPEGSPHLSWTG